MLLLLPNKQALSVLAQTTLLACIGTFLKKLRGATHVSIAASHFHRSWSRTPAVLRLSTVEHLSIDSIDAVVSLFFIEMLPNNLLDDLNLVPVSANVAHGRTLWHRDYLDPIRQDVRNAYDDAAQFFIVCRLLPLRPFLQIFDHTGHVHNSDAFVEEETAEGFCNPDMLL